MVSLRLISAMVLVYCTIVTANPTSDAWFMKEMNELMEAKEQMDQLINDGEPMTEEYGKRKKKVTGWKRNSKTMILQKQLILMSC